MVSASRAGSSIDRHDHQHLGRDALVELDVGLERRLHASASAPRARRSSRPAPRSSSASTRKNCSAAMKRSTRARCLPSTSTFTVPSGSRRSWMIVPSVPTAEDVVGGRLVRLRLLLGAEEDGLVAAPSPLRARRSTSRARRRAAPPCAGNTMMSRSGSSGRPRALRLRRPRLPSSLRKNMDIASVAPGPDQDREDYHREHTTARYSVRAGWRATLLLARGGRRTSKPCDLDEASRRSEGRREEPGPSVPPGRAARSRYALSASFCMTTSGASFLSMTSSEMTISLTFRLARHVVHDVEHRVLEDRAQAAGAGLVLQAPPGDRRAARRR